MANLTLKLHDLTLDEPVNNEIDKNFHVLRVRLIYPNYQQEVMETIVNLPLEEGQALSENKDWNKKKKSVPYHDVLFKTPIEDECFIEIEVSHGIKETMATKVSEELLKAATSKLTDLLPFGNVLDDLTSGIDFGPKKPTPIARAFIKVSGGEQDIRLLKAPGCEYQDGLLTIPMAAPEKIVKRYYAQGHRGGPRELKTDHLLKKGQANGRVVLNID